MHRGVDKESVGNRIKNIRQKMGLSQQAFGEELDNEAPAHKSLVSKWEKGMSLPNNERLKRIAELGELSVNDLLYGEYKAKVYNIFKDVEKELISNYPLLSSDNKFSEFFDNIDDFRENTFEDISKIQIFHENDIRSFYHYRLGSSLPFGDSPNEFSIKVNMLRTSGFYSESSIPPMEKVTNVIYDWIYRDDSYSNSSKNLNKKALEDTINTLNDISIEIEDREIIFIYTQNEQFYDDTSDIRINNKNSYIDYLDYTISQFNDLYKQNPKLESYFEKNLKYYKYLIDVLKN
ncbi:helix-turn-helix domain-containing protein [Marinilactibacillus sp. Marseille-P9653]|uniref:helix-turn-helix domain-containing protein n=1 Tax=Marinilactibacillus sp. Marseille-P9653 TaxID=2866583 RepID=UPI001CE4801D|nr:helix-turn-helix transcriptional regulator [Marinilactibacillus sp. Marseille-P9653]